MRHIDSIVIHCSDTPAGRNVTAADIRSWHKARGFVDIGYHFVITLDISIGICYIGGKTADGRSYADTRTDAQKVALHSLVTRLRKQYGIPADRVFGHRDFAPKACPCFDVHKEEW